MAAGVPSSTAIQLFAGVLTPASLSDRPYGGTTATLSLISGGFPRNEQRPGLSAVPSGRCSSVGSLEVALVYVMTTLNSTSRAPAIPSSLKPFDR